MPEKAVQMDALEATGVGNTQNSHITATIPAARMASIPRSYIVRAAFGQHTN